MSRPGKKRVRLRRRCADATHGSDVTSGGFRLRPPPLPPALQLLPLPSSRLVLPKMAPLDLDKYVEIARQCKYLPENDLKVSRAGGRPVCEASPFRLWGARQPALLPRPDPYRAPGPGAAEGLRGVRRPGPTRRDAENQGSPSSPNAGADP